MKASQKSIWLFMILLAVLSCKKKERELLDIPNIASTAIQELQSKSYFDAPIVMHDENKLIIHNLKRNADLSLVAITDTSYSNEPSISIHLNNQLEFEVDIRENHQRDISNYHDIDSIFVSSDMEGNYKAFVSLLRNNKIIDRDKNWTYGDNHLVLVGDMVDRGNEVLQVLWLIYKLEAQAKQGGGQVHYLLGNHEQMNLWSKYRSQNLAYVHPDYQRYASTMGVDYPSWFSERSKLGRWLMTKNTVLSIDSILFVHGGISKSMAKLKMSYDEINQRVESSLSLNPDQLDRTDALIHSEKGPLWYRGIADREMNQKKLDDILTKMNAHRIVIGHTIVDEHNITPLYQDKVIPIDMHHSKTFKNGIVKGLFIDMVGFYEVDNRGHSKLLFLHNSIEI